MEFTQLLNPSSAVEVPEDPLLIEEQRFFGEDLTLFRVQEAGFELVFFQEEVSRNVSNWDVNPSIHNMGRSPWLHLI